MWATNVILDEARDHEALNPTPYEIVSLHKMKAKISSTVTWLAGENPEIYSLREEISSLLFYYSMFHVKHFNGFLASKCFTWNICYVEHEKHRFQFEGLYGIITSPVTEIEDFERVPENIVSWIMQPMPGCLGCTERKSYDFPEFMK